MVLPHPASDTRRLDRLCPTLLMVRDVPFTRIGRKKLRRSCAISAARPVMGGLIMRAGLNFSRQNASRSPDLRTMGMFKNVQECSRAFNAFENEKRTHGGVRRSGYFSTRRSAPSKCQNEPKLSDPPLETAGFRGRMLSVGSIALLERSVPINPQWRIRFAILMSANGLVDTPNGPARPSLRAGVAPFGHPANRD